MIECCHIRSFGNKKTNKMKQCIIVIPIYKSSPKESEIASFKQCLQILKTHDITIFTHKNCDLHVYMNIADFIGKKVNVELFAADYFKSVVGYNDLCFSAEFYERFSDYEYMCIYQLDAWVFRDEIDYWCRKGYDFIGAPIFYAYNNRKFTNKVCGIGNGGFCIRRISHCLKMINSNQKKTFIKPIPLIKLYWNYFLYDDKFTKSILMRLRIIPTIILKMFGNRNTIEYYRTNHINEDMIFGTWSTLSWGFNGKIPCADEAAKFSFEVHPEMLFDKNGKQLPFGCHAFEKWDYSSFWSKYIKF